MRYEPRQIRRFLKNNDGAIAVLFSLGSVVVVASLSFGVDAANWYQTDRRLQAIVDNVAMSAVAELELQSASSHQGSSLEDLVQSEFTRNGIDTASFTNLQFNSPPTEGAYTGDSSAVEIIAEMPVTVFLSGLFLADAPTTLARAVAVPYASGDFCILALGSNEQEALSFSGSSELDLDCGIASNSNDDEAIHANGSSNVTTTEVRAVGGIEDGGNIESETSPRPYSNPIPDPYAELEIPDDDTCDYYDDDDDDGDDDDGDDDDDSDDGDDDDDSDDGDDDDDSDDGDDDDDSDDGDDDDDSDDDDDDGEDDDDGDDEESGLENGEYQPGVYCKDLTINANDDVTFAPGTYIINGGDFRINGNADVYGEDVTFIFTNSDDPDSPGKPVFNGSARIELSSPDSGYYSGVLLMQDPDAEDTIGQSSDRWIISGNSNSSFNGAFYAPQTTIEITGNSTLDRGCFSIVAGSVSFTGSVEIELDCNGTGFGAIGVTLVE